MAFLFYNRPLFFMASLLRRTLGQLAKNSARRLSIDKKSFRLSSPVFADIYSTAQVCDARMLNSSTAAGYLINFMFINFCAVSGSWFSNCDSAAYNSGICSCSCAGFSKNVSTLTAQNSL
jgi:hypothetical protein